MDIKQQKEERERQQEEETRLLKEIEAMTSLTFGIKAKKQLRGKRIEKGMEYYLESLQRIKEVVQRKQFKHYSEEECIWMAGSELDLQREIK